MFYGFYGYIEKMLKILLILLKINMPIFHNQALNDLGYKVTEKI